MDIAFKENIFEICCSHLNEDVCNLQSELKQYQEAASEETKSSVGDKYETGRAMLHQEQQRLANQIMEKQRVLKLLISFKPSRTYSHIQPGSLVRTSHGFFYFVAGIGEVKYQGHKIHVISLNSPLGKSMMSANVGDTVEFQQRKWKILEIV